MKTSQKARIKRATELARRFNEIGLPNDAMCPECVQEVIKGTRLVWTRIRPDGLLDWAAVPVPENFWERFGNE